MSEVKDFLEILFQHKPPELYILIWTLPEKKSFWAKTVGEAIQRVGELTESNVYVGVGLSNKNYGPNRRCEAKEIAGIVGLWADIDIAGPPHKKANLPPDEASVGSLIEETGLKPTLLIHTGHGFHTWWLFKEPWIFESDEERTKAASLAQGWSDTLRIRARTHGWDIDATGELARVMRVPGTTNYKGTPVPVRTMGGFDAKYNPMDFERHLLKEAPPQPEIVGLVLSPDAEPPFDKFNALLANSKEFKKTWERSKKGDGKGHLQDQSPSGYDMSLALMATAAGWSKQEIANLLIASRRTHGDDLKLREDYYARTIGKAGGYLKANGNVEELLAGPDDPETLRGKALKTLSALFGIGITRIVKYKCDPPEYRLELSNSYIHLGGVNNITSQRLFLDKIADVAGILLTAAARQAWENRVNLILKACVEEDLSEATEPGIVDEWLKAYIKDRRALDNMQEALRTEHPYVKDNTISICLPNFKRWLLLQHGEKLGRHTITRMLRAFGCISKTVNFEDVNGKRTTKQVWQLPNREVLER